MKIEVKIEEKKSEVVPRRENTIKSNPVVDHSKPLDSQPKQSVALKEEVYVGKELATFNKDLEQTL